MPNEEKIAEIEESIIYLTEKLGMIEEWLTSFQFPMKVGEGFVPTTTLPAGSPKGDGGEINLKNCKPYRVWKNKTGNPKDRTVEVRPVRRGARFPNGRVTTYTAPFPQPNQADPGPPKDADKLPPEGDAIGYNVKNGEAIYVHFLGTKPQRQVSAKITQSA